MSTRETPLDRKTASGRGGMGNPPKAYVVLKVAEPFEVLDAALHEHLGRCDGTGTTRRDELTSGSVRYPLGLNASLGSIVLRKSRGPTSIMHLEEVAAAWSDPEPDFSEPTEESARAYLKRLVSSLRRQAGIIHCLFRRLDEDPAYTSGVNWDKLQEALEELSVRSSPPLLRQIEGKPIRPPGPFAAPRRNRKAGSTKDWDEPFVVTTSKPLSTESERASREVKHSRGPNIGTIPAVAEAFLLWKDQGKPQQTACDLAGTTPNTLRRWRSDPRTRKEMERLKADPEYPENLPA